MAIVSYETTLIVTWTLAGVAFVCTGIRYLLRAFVLRNWYWDDLFHGITALVLLATIILITAGRSTIESTSDPHNHEPISERFKSAQKFNIAGSVLGATGFWSTKLAFLFFYRLLFRVKQAFIRVWWIVLIFTILTYWVVFAGCLTQCNGPAANLLDLADCESPAALRLQRTTFIISYSLNIATDLAIIAVPLAFLSALHLNVRRKLGVAVVFCFALIVVAFESLRFGQSVNHSGSNNNILWVLLELIFCVLASCMPTFSALRTWKRNGYRASPSYGYPLQNRSRGNVVPSTQAPKNQSENQSNEQLN